MRWWKRELHGALEFADELLAAANDVKDPAMIMVANFARGVSLLELGELVPANEHQEKALAVFDLRQPLSAGLENSRVSSFGWLHGGLFSLGYPERALAKSREMLEVAERASNPGVLVFASYQAAYHQLEQGYTTAAQKRAEHVMAVTEELGLASISAMATRFALALPWIVQGDHREGIAAMRSGFTAFRATGGTPRIRDLCFLASGLGRAGRPQEALEVVDEGLASVAKTGERIASPSLDRVKGELSLAQTPSDSVEAEQCFRTAIKIAREQSARSGGVARHDKFLPGCSRSRPVATKRARCSPKSTAGSPKGFDTADLKDAKTLLNELAQ